MAGLISATAKAKVRAYAERNMDARVMILRGGKGVLDKTTGRLSGMSDAESIYDDPTAPGTGGIAGIHTVTGQGSVSNGAGQIDTRQVVVSIPWSARLPRRDDVVQVIAGGEDETLNGAALRVVEVAGGTRFADARRISCTVWGKSGYWTGGS